MENAEIRISKFTSIIETSVSPFAESVGAPSQKRTLNGKKIVAPSLSLQKREQDTIALGNEYNVKLMILGLNLEFITHIKQGLTKEKAGKSVAHEKIEIVFPIIRKGSGEGMHRSKLKICIEVLSILASRGPMKLTQLMTKVELNKTRLRQHLRLLKKRNLVERQNLGENKIFYVVTERGLEVLNVIGPVIKEARKFQALQF